MGPWFSGRADNGRSRKLALAVNGFEEEELSTINEGSVVKEDTPKLFALGSLAASMERA